MSRYRAFISYSHEDERFARWLHRALESYRLPKAVCVRHGLSSNRIGPLFRDREELGTSSDLTAVIRDALSQSVALIVICSPAAVNSNWVNKEIELFQEVVAGPIFCITARDESVSMAECIPPALAGQEPLAADVAMDGKRAAKLKLIAGLIGVPLEQLAQRDAHRRQLKWAGVASVSLLGMLLAGGLAAYAFTAEQRAKSEAKQARELTDYMVEMFNVAAPENSRAADISARDLLAHGVERLQQLDVDQATSASIQHTLGKAYLKLQLMEEANEHLQMAKRLAEYDAYSEAGIRLDTDMAKLLIHQGKFSEADIEFGNLIERAAATFGASDVRFWSLTANRGTVKLYIGEPEQAENLLERAYNGLVLVQGLEGKETLSVRSALAVVYSRQGKIEKAIELAKTVLDQQRASLGSDHPETIASLDNLATHYMKNNDWTNALVLVREGRELNASVHGEDSPHMVILDLNLSFVLSNLGEYEEALTAGQNAARMATQYYEPNHKTRLVSVENLAMAMHRNGDVKGAEALMVESIERLSIELGKGSEQAIRAIVVYAELPFLTGDRKMAGERLDRLLPANTPPEMLTRVSYEVDPEFVELVMTHIGS